MTHWATPLATTCCDRSPIDSTPRSATAASAFVREMHLTYPILLDQHQRYGAAYSAIGLPTTVVVDRNGKIVIGHDGEWALADFRKAVAPALRAQ